MAEATTKCHCANGFVSITPRELIYFNEELVTSGSNSDKENISKVLQEKNRHKNN